MDMIISLNNVVDILQSGGGEKSVSLPMSKFNLGNLQ